MIVLIQVTFVLHYFNTSLSSWYIRPFNFIYGSMYCKLLGHLMLAHITAQKFNPFRTSIIMSCLMIYVFLFSQDNYGSSEALLVLFLVVFNILCTSYTHLSLLPVCHYSGK